jgi:hypothetical protein
MQDINNIADHFAITEDMKFADGHPSECLCNVENNDFEMNMIHYLHR